MLTVNNYEEIYVGTQPVPAATYMYDVHAMYVCADYSACKAQKAKARE